MVKPTITSSKVMFEMNFRGEVCLKELPELFVRIVLFMAEHPRGIAEGSPVAGARSIAAFQSRSKRRG
jgi:hypothetical protein